MATSQSMNKNYISTMNKFPDIKDGEINMTQFLEAAADLVLLVERLGKVFAPVKYDMQGNVDKISKCNMVQSNKCLLELMTVESSKGQIVATEGTLWLNRALLFFEIVFHQIILHIRSNNYNVGMTKIFTLAYEGSVKKYHNWVSQQLFSFVCKMSPTLPQLMDSLNVNDDVDSFLTDLMSYNDSLINVRSKIDDYFRINKLFVNNK